MERHEDNIGPRRRCRTYEARAPAAQRAANGQALNELAGTSRTARAGGGHTEPSARVTMGFPFQPLQQWPALLNPQGLMGAPQTVCVFIALRRASCRHHRCCHSHFYQNCCASPAYRHDRYLPSSAFPVILIFRFSVAVSIIPMLLIFTYRHHRL